MATQVLNWNKEKVGTVELNPDVFGVEVRKDLMHTVVRWQLASRRAGTHKAKTRAEVSGGGKKPYKQKGTGSARRGSTRSPLIAGGGVTFGPNPRDYSFTLPRKARQAGLKSALSYLNGAGKLFVVDVMDSKEGKTRELNKRLQKFGLKKAVLIDGEENKVFARAVRNMKEFRYYPVNGLNVYDLLKYDAVVLTKGSLGSVEKKCGVEK